MRANLGAHSGFVLVATLWFLATITIVATYFANQVSQAIASADQGQRMTDAMVDMASTRAEAMLHFATGGFSEWGLGADPQYAIALDDRPYRGVGRDIVRFQDTRGLLNLNFPDQWLLRKLLPDFGVRPEKLPALFDALADYTDIDDLRRLNGAEAPEYQAANLPPPFNDWMYSPRQLKSVYGWHEFHELWNEGRLLPLFTTSKMPGFNPNTAPREILIAIAGRENKPLIEEIMDLRKANPVLAKEKTAALINALSMETENVFLIPASVVRITQQSRNLPWAFEMTLMLTPHMDSRPWRIDYFSRTNVGLKDLDEDTLPRLPAATLQTIAAGSAQVRAKP